jgi:hypothetical protein
MHNQTPNGERLVQHWVEVRDTDGRVHLESRWVVEPATAPVSTGHAA